MNKNKKNLQGKQAYFYNISLLFKLTKKSNYFTHNTSYATLVSWDQPYLNSSKECIPLFHQKLLFDLSKYMAVDIMKILCKKISCGPQMLHNDI